MCVCVCLGPESNQLAKPPQTAVCVCVFLEDSAFASGLEELAKRRKHSRTAAATPCACGCCYCCCCCCNRVFSFIAKRLNHSARPLWCAVVRLDREIRGPPFTEPCGSASPLARTVTLFSLEKVWKPAGNPVVPFPFTKHSTRKSKEGLPSSRAKPCRFRIWFVYGANRSATGLGWGKAEQ